MEKTLNLAFDMETDGLDSPRIHGIVTQDLDTGLVEEYNDEKYSDNPKELPMSSHSICTNGYASILFPKDFIFRGIVFLFFILLFDFRFGFLFKVFIKLWVMLTVEFIPKFFLCHHTYYQRYSIS